MENAANTEMDRLRTELEEVRRDKDRFERRCLTKDREFDQERQVWRREKRELLNQVANLNRELKRARRA